MEIKIKSGDELNKLLNALGRQIVSAHNYHRLYSDIAASIAEYEREFRESNTFWSLCLEGLRDAYLVRLCRIYDQHAKTLNLANLLHTISANRHYFEEEHFRDRLKENAFVDSLASKARIPSEEQLAEDIQFASAANPVVEKLIVWRNNVIAHTGSKVSLGASTILEKSPVSHEEVKNLLGQALTIFNRYSKLYRASSWSSTIIGHDDFRSSLRLVRTGLESNDDKIAREIARDRECNDAE